MNVIFKDDALRELYEKGKTKDSRYKELCRNKVFIDNYIGVIDLTVSVERTDDLRAYSYLHYEKLRYRPEKLGPNRQPARGTPSVYRT